MENLTQSLTTELQTYEKHKEELLQQEEGKYVLIKGETILGTYNTKLSAVAAGHEQVGLGPFLVKQVLRVEKEMRILLPRVTCP